MRHRLLWLLIVMFCGVIFCWGIHMNNRFEDQIDGLLAHGKTHEALMVSTHWTKAGGCKDPDFFRSVAKIEKALGHDVGVAWNLKMADKLEGK